MSDDLVKRLRDTPNWMREGFQDWKDNVRTYDRAPFEAADRIEELEAKLAKAVEALERIGKGEFAGQMLMSLPPQDAGAHFARMTLAIIKLKGKCDD